MEAVEALKISERHPTSPGNLEEYLLSKNNGSIYTGDLAFRGLVFRVKKAVDTDILLFELD